MGDLVADLLFEASFPPLVPPSGMLEVLPESGDRIAGPPRRDLRFVAVSSRVIARGVRSEAVRHGLDHGRPLALAGASGRVAGRSVDREGVHAIDADAIEAVRRRFLRERRGGRLLRDRDGDGPLIVVAQEDGRSAEDAREVHRTVEVRGARRPVAEEDQDRVRLASEPHRPSDADRVGELRADR